ncbi:MAG: zinc ribbon domain-containing protein [Desulfobulbaceae bacterium]|nr:zinc ribbon domain-containing protein [Desulfobulbaceae bacterium]
MPIYEFYCPDCNTIFNFYSRRVAPGKQPDCPQCGRKKIRKMMSSFATIGKARWETNPLAGMDEAKVGNAFEGLLREAENVNENDPRQMARLMRKFSDKTGISLGERMQEAMSRLEDGENPDQVEREIDDLLQENDISFEQMKKQVHAGRKQPKRDDKLYELE